MTRPTARLVQLPISSIASTRQIVSAMPLRKLVDRTIKLIRLYEPPEGYYQAFSGGKDSVVVEELLKIAKVKREKHYHNTTIDPPELVRFIKREHTDTIWSKPKYGNMLHRIATAPKIPPTRNGRWCCDEYKEGGGKGRVKVFGVRAEESKSRAANWKEVTQDRFHDTAVCPIAFWTTEQVWEFIRRYSVPYCSLYDEGFDRLGCVGCPLADSKKQRREFDRWPKYEAAWKRAIVANWERWHAIPNTRTGEPRYHAKFSSGEAFWEWWLTGVPENSETCQSNSLWTNEEAA